MIVWLILQLLENCRQVYLLLWAFQDFMFILIISWLFQGARKYKPSNTQTLVLVDLRRSNIGREFFSFCTKFERHLTTTTFAKPWTGFMLNMFCPQVHLCSKSLPPMSKKWANLDKRWLFTSAVQDTNVIVGLRLLTTGQTWQRCSVHRERNKIWFKISSNGEHIHASSFQEKTWILRYQYCSFANFCEMKVSPKSGLFSPWTWVGLKQMPKQT